MIFFSAAAAAAFVVGALVIFDPADNCDPFVSDRFSLFVLFLSVSGFGSHRGVLKDSSRLLKDASNRIGLTYFDEFVFSPSLDRF